MKQVFIHIPDQLKEMLVPIDTIFPYEKNPRKHTEKGISAIAEAIRAVGFVDPIVVDQSNRIAAGHGRRLAALKIGMTHIPVVKMIMNEEVFINMLLSNNKVSEFSVWDKKLLNDVAKIFEELNEVEFNVPGFSDEDIDKIFGHSYKESLNTKADFGDAGEVDGLDESTRVTSMTFKMTVLEHKKIKGVIGAIMREHDLETIGEALIYIVSKFKGPGKTIRRIP